MSARGIRIARMLALALTLLLLLVGGTLLILRGQYTDFLQQPMAVSAEGRVLMVDAGMSGRAVIQRLQELGITRWNWQWRILMRQQPAALKVGEYALEHGLTPPQLLRQLQSGEVIHYRFTIVEGWTLAQLLSALQADEMLGKPLESVAELMSVAREIAGAENPEGWFLPETYQFVRGYTAADLLKRAYQDMQAVLSRAWESRADGLPLQSPYELLILASIIERETAVDSERDEISGVFVRRLQSGMRLQTDPTVIYGLGEAYDGNIRKVDLQTDTAYNTYTRHGLPPTPIALPGVASLQAAARPKEGTSLYFVANGQGGHTFSDTLEDHQEAVNVMLGRKP